MPDPSTKQKVVVELFEKLDRLDDRARNSVGLTKAMLADYRAALSAQDVQEGKRYCIKCGSEHCRHGLPLVSFAELQKIHNKPAEEEKRCGGSGFVRVEGEAVDGAPSIGVPESVPCDGCPDCSPEAQEGPEEDDEREKLIDLLSGEDGRQGAITLFRCPDHGYFQDEEPINERIEERACPSRECFAEIAGPFRFAPLLSEGVGEDGQETLDDLVAKGRCPDCGTLAGIWHKLGCPRDFEQPDPTQQPAQEGDEAALRAPASARSAFFDVLAEGSLDEALDAAFAAAPHLELSGDPHKAVQPTEDQEGEDDWPEVWVSRDPISGTLRSTTGSAELTPIPPVEAIRSLARRYIPAPTQPVHEDGPSRTWVLWRAELDGPDDWNLLTPSDRPHPGQKVEYVQVAAVSIPAPDGEER